MRTGFAQHALVVAYLATLRAASGTVLLPHLLNARHGANCWRKRIFWLALTLFCIATLVRLLALVILWNISATLSTSTNAVTPSLRVCRPDVPHKPFCNTTTHTSPNTAKFQLVCRAPADRIDIVLAIPPFHCTINTGCGPVIDARRRVNHWTAHQRGRRIAGIAHRCLGGLPHAAA